MTYQITPTPKDFNPSKPQLVYARIINDIDTPVSAFLKIAENKPYAFLFESVQGGEIRGRYSFLGFSPDIIWKSYGDISEISRDGGKFEQSKKKASGIPKVFTGRKFLCFTKRNTPHGSWIVWLSGL